MAGILEAFNDPSTQGLLSLSSNLLRSAGPSAMPVPFGAALGNAYAGYQQDRSRMMQDAQRAQLIELEKQKGALLNAKTQGELNMQNMMQGVMSGGGAGGGGMPLELLHKLATMAAIGGHPGAATLESIAARKEAAIADQQALKGYQSQMVPIPAVPTEGEAIARLQSGEKGSIGFGDNPQTHVQRGGVLAPYLASPNPEIAQRAQMLQSLIDKGGPSMTTKIASEHADRLAAQSANFAQQNALMGARGAQQDKVAQFNVNNRPVPVAKMPVSETAPSLSPEAIAAAAEGYGVNQKLPSNLGRGVQGSANTAAILNKNAEDLKAKGMTGESARISQMAATSIGSALSSLERQRANVMAYEKTALAGADIALEMSDKVSRVSNIPIVDKWIQSGQKNILGDPDVTRLHNAVETMTNEYAKVMSGSSGGQATTVSMQQHAREMLNGAHTKEQFKGVIDLMKREMTTTRETAFDAQINEMKMRLKPPSSTSGKSDGPRKYNPATGKIE